MADPPSDTERLQRERELYRRLLDVCALREIERFLAAALEFVVEVTGARRGYLELRDDAGEEARPLWWHAQGLSVEEVGDVRAFISRGIVAEALVTGRTVSTASALLDPRFEGRESVRARGIQAVLCAPIGADSPFGVLYLEGVEGAGPWSEENRLQVERLARDLASPAERLLLHERSRARQDATRSLRERLRLDGVVGRGRALAEVLQQAALVAPLDVTVLLTGESGTGKSQLARVVHDNGARAAAPFVELNCASIPETLVESELFGARAGAHSTARRSVEGKVAAAEGGTLFLDEIGELPFAAQAKLLQLLQSHEYYPLGANRPVSADVRVIAATQLDLEQAVAERRFREDLYYRLRVIPIRLPTLAERPEDVAELAGFFCEQACARHGLPHLGLSPAALHAVEAAEWPGNVRQLAHAVEAAAIRSAGEGAIRIERRHLFPDEERSAGGEVAAATFQEATRQFQCALLRRSLEETDWNITETARRLDLARSHVYNLIRAFGLERHEEGGTSAA